MENSSYTVDWLNKLRLYFGEDPSTRIVAQPLIKTSEGTSFSPLETLLQNDIDGLLFITGAVDTAFLARQLYKRDIEIPMFACGWAMTEELIAHGGPGVEGLIISHQFNPQSKKKSYLHFKEAYREAYDEEPTFAAAYGYEAVRVLAEALEHNPDPDQLKQTLLEIRRFEGLQHPILFDRFGDVHRERFLLQIKNGKYTPVEPFS
jgi:branched-chain amino acid transport system substrate-binding protein